MWVTLRDIIPAIMQEVAPTSDIDTLTLSCFQACKHELVLTPDVAEPLSLTQHLTFRQQMQCTVAVPEAKTQSAPHGSRGLCIS